AVPGPAARLPRPSRLAAALRREPEGLAPSARLLAKGCRVRALACRPDAGELIAACDSAVLRWSLSDLRTTHEHPNYSPGLCAATSPAHAVVFTGNALGEVQLWDAEGCRDAWPAANGPVDGVVVATSGAFLASIGGYGGIGVWQLPGGRLLRRLLDGTKVTALVPHPTTDLIFAGDADGQLQSWDPATGLCVHRLAGHAGGVRALAVSPAAGYLASAGQDGSVCLWDLSDGHLRVSLTSRESPAAALASLADGSWLVLGCDDGAVRLLRLPLGRCVRTVPLHEGPIVSLVARDDPPGLFSAGADGTARWLEARHEPGARRAPLVISEPVSGEVVDRASGEYRRLLRGAAAALEGGDPERSAEALRAARSLPDRQRAPEAVRGWTALYGRLTRRRPRAVWMWAVIALCFRPGAGTLVTQDVSGRILEWDLENGRVVRAGGVPEPRAVVIGAVGGGTGLVLRTPRGEVLLQDPEARIVERHELGGPVVAWAPRAEVAAAVCGGSRSRGAELAVLDTAARSVRRAALAGPDVSQRWAEQITVCAVGPDAERLLLGDEGGRLSLWGLADAQRRGEWEGHRSAVTAAVLCSGSGAVSAAEDGTVTRWDLARGKPLWSHRTHAGPVRALALTSDQQHLFSVGADGAIQLWRADVGDGLTAWESGPSVVVADDVGAHVIGGQADGTVRVWLVDWELGGPPASPPAPLEGRR
ncbi:MAG: hypothetical protein HYU66_23990, partial [Armatimonadetes bacterium]|nr:hypothetical protein [Armatimonadota bacterium]